MQKRFRHKREKKQTKLFGNLYGWVDSWFVKNGTIENCMDADIHMIQNEKIDEISKVINEDFERLLELQTTNEESVVL